MKKTLTVVAILALAVTLLPAAFAQTSDQNSPSSSSPAASSPAASPSASPAQTSPAQTSPAETSPAQTSPSTPDQPSAQGSASGASQTAESFTGTVVKSGDKYVLKTDSGTYQIDDQDKAKQFEGKQVKVSGSLDKATSTLHITDIQAAMQQ